MNIELIDFVKAKERIENVLHPTELDYSRTFSNMTGGNIYIKKENDQKTGSFKVRGATNKIASMIENGNKSNVVAASAGNHAQGVALAASKFGIKATIVMPKTAPIAKIDATKGYGANVVLAGSCYDDSYKKAIEICNEENAIFLHPYDDLEVITGQGTLALEILDQLPNTDIIIVPAGGGGLLAGVSTAAKHINPKVKVYGVQASGANAIVQSFKKKSKIVTETSKTIADGIAVKNPGDKTLQLIYQNVDGMLEVSDSEIADAVLMLIERCKTIVEPSGAAPIAAVLSNKIDVKGKNVVCVASGGNIDATSISSIIEKGLYARNRKFEATILINDGDHSLINALQIIQNTGSKVLAVEGARNSLLIDNETERIYLVLEASGDDHKNQILQALNDEGFNAKEIVEKQYLV